MLAILKNILAVITGVVIGGIVNMAIIMMSDSVIALPDGVNPADPESLKANMHLFEPKHFLMPFLAHALGTLVGAFIAAKIAATYSLHMAIFVGAFFLLGGIANVAMLPAPMWFNVLDLVLAYIPMGHLAWILAGRKKARPQ